MAQMACIASALDCSLHCQPVVSHSWTMAWKLCCSGWTECFDISFTFGSTLSYFKFIRMGVGCC